MEDYRVEELFEMLKEDSSWEENEQIRIMIAQGLKGIIISL
ncbi:MAG: hypothetical protein ACOWWR_18295 [Eubacteriales bacterium]